MNRKLVLAIALCLVGLWSCSSTTENTTKEIALDSDFALSTDTIVNNDDRFLYFDNLTDSTYLLVWGGKGYTNTSADTMPVLNNGKLYLDWADEDVICVRQGCGTGCVYAYVLPLRPSAREIMYFYPIDYDTDNHLVAFSNDMDSTISVENYLTQKRYTIDAPIKNSLGSFGLDSTSFGNKKLFIKWWDEDFNSHSKEYKIAD